MNDQTKKSTINRVAQSAINAAWPYLTGRRGQIMIAVGVMVAGATLNWGWLVAVGVAPLLLSVLPCVIMCAFGVCMMGGSCKKSKSNVDTSESNLPASETVDQSNYIGTNSNADGQTRMQISEKKEL